MKSVFNKTLMGFLAVALFTACEKDDDGHDHHEKEGEFEYVRVLTTDGTSTKLTHIKPVDGTTISFDARHPNGTLYTTESGRFSAIIHGSQNVVEFFDSGLEYHGDHVDIKGTPKFAAIIGDGIRPSHFKSKGTEAIVFNDGDGTLTVANESEFHTAGSKMRVINAGVQPHHGAMVKFDNGNYAITVNNSGATLAGPHGVKIINSTGAQVATSSLPTGRIHGNATDGTNAVFGADGGALLVNQTGQQRLIPNPAGWGTVRMGTILYAKEAKKFIGYTNLKGAYFVNITTNQITPIFESTTIMQCKVDMTGKNLFILLLDGSLKIYDLTTGNLKKQGTIIPVTAATETFKPVLEATSKYAYIALPALGEVHQVKLENLSDVKKIKVSGQPTKLTILGFESSHSH